MALLVHGNPLFLVSATEYTLDFAERHDLRVSVLPAVSSFDTLLCDLRLDWLCHADLRYHEVAQGGVDTLGWFHLVAPSRGQNVEPLPPDAGGRP